jgi:hypothetical protein
VFATTFSGNSASNGDDIYNIEGTVTIHSTCPAGYEGSSAEEGFPLDTGGAINGPLFSIIGCAVCSAGGYSTSPGSDCVVCPAGSVLTDANHNPIQHDSVEDCSACPAGTTLLDEGTDSALHDSLDDCDTVCPAGTCVRESERVSE